MYTLMQFAYTMQKYIVTGSHTHTHTRTHVHMHICTHAHMHTYMHLHTTQLDLSAANLQVGPIVPPPEQYFWRLEHKADTNDCSYASISTNSPTLYSRQIYNSMLPSQYIKNITTPVYVV